MEAIETTPWTPIDLTADQQSAIAKYREELCSDTVELNLQSVSQASDALSVAMYGHIDQLMERDTIPTLCHIINGWGNGTYRGHKLTDYLASFIQSGKNGEPFIAQSDREGEVHPWQSFAYAVMAGVPPGRLLGPSGLSLRDLALTSRDLNTEDGTQLGHLLFALSALDPRIDGPLFTMGDRRLTVRQSVEVAIEAHYYGDFFVCRKFHLTEGLCAASAQIPGLQEYRGAAALLLEGQLDVLFPLSIILEDAWRHAVDGLALESDSLATGLRDALALGPMFENHCYYAGHLIELACFARLHGFEISAEHRQAMNRILNQLNTLIPLTLPNAAFTQCFLHLGHYRRAATLYGQIAEAEQTAPSIGIPDVDLTAYTVDFDDRSVLEPPMPAGKEISDRLFALNIYELAAPSEEILPHLTEAVAEYRRTARLGFEPRGGYNHFRRISPPWWPKSIHYELLHYPDGIGVEIHVESKQFAWIEDILRTFEAPLRATFKQCDVAWLPEWWEELGRLRILFPNSVSPSAVAAGLNTCIDMTFDQLDKSIRERFHKTISRTALYGAAQHSS